MLRSCVFAFLICLCGAASAAEPAGKAPSAPSGFVSELRFGGSYHALAGRERGGGVDLHAEVLSIKPIRYADPVWDALVPRFHLGGSLNTDGRTSYAYAGATWTFDITPRIFIEGSLGGALHDGNTGSVRKAGEASLGCSPLFRESASLGFRLSGSWSLLLTIDHISNAGLCRKNDGLTNVGARLGYTF